MRGLCPPVKDFLPGLTMGGIITFFTRGTAANVGTTSFLPGVGGDDVAGDPSKTCLWAAEEEGEVAETAAAAVVRGTFR